MPMAFLTAKVSSLFLKSWLRSTRCFSHHFRLIMKRLLASISSITGFGTGVVSSTVWSSIFRGVPTALP